MHKYFLKMKFGHIKTIDNKGIAKPISEGRVNGLRRKRMFD